MSREWKPGDVALLRFTKDGDGEGVGVYRGGGKWSHSSAFGGGSAYAHIGGFVIVRPLVVIDPEDPEDRKRLAYHLARIGGDWSNDDGAVRVVLQAMLAPPRPPEPMGLGAVVEDEVGTRWVRNDSTPLSQPWVNLDDCTARYRRFADFTAVRVLSEGVTPEVTP